ncbi:uncharacterized protein EMH_0087080 [Eimeria mitis]|uniref:Uncharacterized protein n=1 Tax=Eimeria mitis TaxID=44415 RepID=U6KCQ4_9EIME|nr:uncharacterized protein EMH_0087080 [Eimeria mitis]CDJ34002.1 hypothetical protein, conserved [Eimeria mitis]
MNPPPLLSRALQREGLLPLTSCRIEVFLYNRPLLCSPLEPLICNLEELQQMYREAEAATQLGASIKLFEDFLRRGLHDKATKILSSIQHTSFSHGLQGEAKAAVMRLCCSSNSPRSSLQQQLQQACSSETETEQQQQQQQLLLLSPREKKQKEKEKLRNLQRQWEDIQIVREALMKLCGDTERQQEMITKFTENILQGFLGY